MAPESLDFKQYFSASSLEEMENREDLLDLARQAYASLVPAIPILFSCRRVKSRSLNQP